MKVVVIEYNAGNTCSVAFALNRLGIDPVISSDVDEILSADKLILPGVGSAGSAMQYLKDKSLDKVIRDIKNPLLGICLGMQLLCNYSEEDDTACLGLFDTKVKKMQKGRVPHIGWNQVYDLKGPLFDKISEGRYMYFVHSYSVQVNSFAAAVSDHIETFSAAIQKNNFYGVQFHPEKSGDDGLALLNNFISL